MSEPEPKSQPQKHIPVHVDSPTVYLRYWLSYQDHVYGRGIVEAPRSWLGMDLVKAVSTKHGQTVSSNPIIWLFDDKRDYYYTGPLQPAKKLDPLELQPTDSTNSYDMRVALELAP